MLTCVFFNRYRIYTANNTLYKCTPRWRFISSIRNYDHVLKTLYSEHCIIHHLDISSNNLGPPPHTTHTLTQLAPA